MKTIQGPSHPSTPHINPMALLILKQTSTFLGNNDLTDPEIVTEIKEGTVAIIEQTIHLTKIMASVKIIMAYALIARIQVGIDINVGNLEMRAILRTTRRKWRETMDS